MANKKENRTAKIILDLFYFMECKNRDKPGNNYTYSYNSLFLFPPSNRMWRKDMN